MQQLDRQGVALAYAEAGSGAPPILLVHGFGGDHTHLAPQFEHFRQHHRVVSVDRRGHGQSDGPEQEYTIEQFADDLAWMCDELGLYKPVVVVHSQDKIALDLAARYPDLPAAIVILDGAIFPPQAVAEAFEGFLQGLRTPHYREALQQFADQVAFLPTDNQERKARIIGAMTALPQHVIISTWKHYVAYDAAAAAASCKVPMLWIASQMPSDLARLRELCPQLVVGHAVGAGHFAQLEVPDQVNAMIERFLAITLFENGFGEAIGLEDMVQSNITV
jgi:pimeloyl-ACP methyl ester carboxylesterase